jgi:hypothetical protein
LRLVENAFPAPKVAIENMVAISALGPGCVKTVGEKAFAQQWNRTSRRRNTLLRLKALMRINIAQNLPGNSFFTAWVKLCHKDFDMYSSKSGVKQTSPARWTATLEPNNARRHRL